MYRVLPCSPAGLGGAGSGVTAIEGILQSGHFSSGFAQLQELYRAFYAKSCSVKTCEDSYTSVIRTAVDTDLLVVEFDGYGCCSLAFRHALVLPAELCDLRSSSRVLLWGLHHSTLRPGTCLVH